MPSLGGLLKKRRTKDSQTLSKELEAGSAQTQTSPNAAEDHHNQNHHHHLFHHHHHHQPATNSGSSTNPPAQPQNSVPQQQPNRSSGADKSSDGQVASMQSAVTQASPSAHHTSGLPQPNANAASIQNIIHPSQQGAMHSASSGHAQSHHAARSDARTTKGKYSLDDFTLQRTLGTGSFGRVHLVQSKHNHRFYAVKVLKKAQVVKMKQIEHTNDERRMLNRVRHPFLITLWGTWQDSRNLYMVMDFVEGGELFSLLRKSQVG